MEVGTMILLLILKKDSKKLIFGSMHHLSYWTQYLVDWKLLLISKMNVLNPLLP
jgi:hypothetical protein